MKNRPLTADNHYVPQTYLKHWAGDNGKVWVYRTLVSHPNVPQWKQASPKGFAFHEHLYTRLAAGSETDEIERWLSSEFETPAAPVLQKVANGDRISAPEWKHLIRFLAAQHVRTPARMIELTERWRKEMPQFLHDSLTEGIEEVKSALADGRSLTLPRAQGAELFPMKVSTMMADTPDEAILRFETVVGRGLWLFSMKRLLTTTLNALLSHRWTILCSPPGDFWHTSDDPVVPLNFYNPTKYDFRGGWGSRGTEIFMPLSPKHLLYTRIGHKPPMRGTIATPSQFGWFQRFIVEHAHRFVIASQPDPHVLQVRPRTVDQATFKMEHEQWKDWHTEQTNAERDLQGQPPLGPRD